MDELDQNHREWPGAVLATEESMIGWCRTGCGAELIT